jgi:hypothetical protein
LTLFDVVTYDAGGFSRANADAVIAAGKDYLFALKDEHRTMCRLADELLAFEKVIDKTEDVLDNETNVVRSLKLLRADPSWSYGDGKTPGESVWQHAKAFLSVEYVKVQRGVMIERDERMFVSSLDPKRLTTAQWLLLVRSHWGVENQSHPLEGAAPVGARRAHRRHRRAARGAPPARRRRRHTLKSPGSHPRRATSQGRGASGWRERRRPPRRPLAPTSSRLPPPAHRVDRDKPVSRQADHA